MQADAKRTETVKQYGRQVRLGEGGTHVRPEPQATSFKQPVTIDGTCDGEALPQVFDVVTQLLSEGRSDVILAGTDRLKIMIKCYASGGENYLHAHTEEDHVFLVLAGSARFWSDHGPIATVSANQGVLIPHGAYYAFQSDAPEPLVLLRAGVPWEGGRVITLEDVDRQLDARDIAFPDPVAIPGAFYPSSKDVM